MEEIVADAVALADELGWQEFSWIGHSMGGVAIQRALVDAPDRVRRLVGINPVPSSPFPWDEQGWALFSGAPDSRDNRYAIIDFTTGNRLTPTFINFMVDHSLTHSNRDAFAAYLEPWGKANFADQIKGNETPIKVIVGAHDPALSAELMQQTFMQYYPNAELQVAEDGGHYPMFEAPILLVTSVEEFLSR
jgi:pimeloyl-ACP methyl ester carboxylesterase